MNCLRFPCELDKIWNNHPEHVYLPTFNRGYRKSLSNRKRDSLPSDEVGTAAAAASGLEAADAATTAFLFGSWAPFFGCAGPLFVGKGPLPGSLGPLLDERVPSFGGEGLSFGARVLNGGRASLSGDLQGADDKLGQFLDQGIFIWWEKFLIGTKGQTARMTDRCVLAMLMSPLSCKTRTSWRPTWWTSGWRQCGLPAQQIVTL
jgi:hypothetical protein